MSYVLYFLLLLFNLQVTCDLDQFTTKIRELRMLIIGIVPGLWTARYLLRTSQEEQPKIIHAEGDLNKIS